MANVAVIHIVTALRCLIGPILVMSKVQSALMCKCVAVKVVAFYFLKLRCGCMFAMKIRLLCINPSNFCLKQLIGIANPEL